MRIISRWLVAALCILGGLLPTQGQAKRVALVIGNADYKIGRLANPVRDAEAVAAALKGQLKFDKVILHKDLRLDGFRDALREMAVEAVGAELGVIYFAGHGIEVRGRNFLVPIDGVLASETAIDLEAIALDTVLRQLDGVTRLRLVILDACRTNPFPAARRGSTRGLKSIEPDGGTLVAYAARDGTTADDGKGWHSPFTAALLKRIVTPGLDVRRMFGYVSDDVKAATGQAQVPHLYGQLGGDEVHLLPAANAKPLALPPLSEGAETVRICREVEGMSSLSLLAVLERQHKGRPASECVTARIEELRKQQTVVVVPPKPAPAPVPEVAPLNPRRASTPLTAAEERGLRPRDSFKECAECPEMVVVPAGDFMMGSAGGGEADESPAHRVTIARPFAAGIFEVTFDEWDACANAGGCSRIREDSGWGRGKRPVIYVSWDQATKQYLPWLSRRTGKTYRLLSEAEWEYAARARATTLFAFGNTLSTAQAQFNAKLTLPVGSFRPNAFGLYDMHGNVWEWVQDCWNGSYHGAPSDGSAWTTGDCGHRVLRGGSFSYGADGVRAANRFWLLPAPGMNSTGFRVGRTM